MRKKDEIKVKEKVNWPVTILLIIGLVTVVFPLYMTVVIAFKQPSEMTNSIAGILSLPKTWSFSNFIEAIQVTDFWHSLINSVLITGVTVVVSILVHSMVGYAIGRNKMRSKFYNFAYLYIVSGMFVPFAILMMPLVKQTANWGIANPVGVILCYVVFYMPMNVLLYSGYLTNIPVALEEAAKVDGATTWRTYWTVIFPIMKPMHATVAVLTALGTWNDVMTPPGHHVRKRPEYASAGSDDIPDPVWNQLQPCICFLSAGSASDSDFLRYLSEADLKRSGKRSREVRNGVSL